MSRLEIPALVAIGILGGGYWVLSANLLISSLHIQIFAPVSGPIVNMTATVYTFSLETDRTLAPIFGFFFVAALAMGLFLLGIRPGRALAASGAGVMGYLLIVEVLALARWLTNLVDRTPAYSDPTWAYARLEADYFTTTQTVAPLIAAVCLFSWLLRPAAARYLGSAKQILGLSGRGPRSTGEIQESRRHWTRATPVLVAATVISSFLAYLPYLTELNPSGRLVGTDAHWYLERLMEMRELDPARALFMAFRNERAVFLFMTYALNRAVENPQVTVAMLPVMIATIFPISSYVLAYTLTRDYGTSALSAVLAATSPHLTSALFGGIYANWFALSLAYLYFSLLLSVSRRFSAVRTLLAVILGLLIAASHPWTWGINAGVTFLFVLVLTLRALGGRGREEGRALRGLGVILSTLVATAFVGLSAGGRTTVEIGLSSIGGGSILGLDAFWTELIETMRFWVGSAFSDFPIFALAAIGVYAGPVRERNSRALLMAILLVPSISMFYFVPGEFLKDNLQWRLLFSVPWQILAALGARSILARLRAYRHGDLMSAFFLLLILFVSANYTLRLLTNLQ